MSSDKTSTLLLLCLTISLLIALSPFAPIPEVTELNSNKSIPEFRVGSQKVKKRRKIVLFSEWHPAEEHHDLPRNFVLNVTAGCGPSNGVVSTAKEVHMENDLTTHHAAVVSSGPSVLVATWLQIPKRTRKSSSAKNIVAANYKEGSKMQVTMPPFLAGTTEEGRADTSRREFRAHGVNENKSRADIDQQTYDPAFASSLAFHRPQAHDAATPDNDEVGGDLGAQPFGDSVFLAIGRSGPELGGGGETTFAALLHRKWTKRNQTRKDGRIRRSTVTKRRSRGLNQPKNPGGGNQKVAGMVGARSQFLIVHAWRPFRTREIVLRQRVPRHEASTSGLASLGRHHRVLPLFN